MGFFDFLINQKTEYRDEEPQQETQMQAQEEADADVLGCYLGNDSLDRNLALQIPAVSACANKIADTIASLRIDLLNTATSGNVEKVENDERVKLLNCDTGDTLTPYELKKELILDMLLSKGGYCYIERRGSKIKSLRYVETDKVSYYTNNDPIYKDYQLSVQGQKYNGWDFVKLLRNSKNGYSGKSIIEESPLLLQTMYQQLKYEKVLARTSGGKRGYLEADRPIKKEKLIALKKAFRKMYADNDVTDNVVVLGEGVKFREASATAAELQLNENKSSNTREVCKLFGIPHTIIEGGGTKEDRKIFHEGCILPIVALFEDALNSTLLKASELSSHTFKFDTDTLTKSDIKERYEAYELGYDNGFLQIDDIRRAENLPDLGLNFIKLGLSDVLYYPDENKIYTPNTGIFADLDKNQKEIIDITDNEGGVNNAN